MSMTKYQPSGKSDPGGVPKLFGAALLAGAAVGLLLHFIGQWIYLLFVFPAGMGIAAGAATAVSVDKLRVRAPLVAMLAAASGAALSWATDPIMDYRAERENVRGQVEPLASQEEGLDGAAVDRAVNAVFAAWGRGEEVKQFHVIATLHNKPTEFGEGEEAFVVEPLGETGAVGAFVGFLESRAKAGTKISRAASGSSGGIDLGEAGTYILWALELLFAAGLAAGAARGAAREPYCELSGNWYAKASDVAAFATADKKAALAAVAAGDASTLKTLVTPEGKHRLLLAVRRCGMCEEAPAEVQVLVPAGQKEPAVLKTGMMAPEIATGLLKAVAPPEAPLDEAPAAEGAA